MKGRYFIMYFLKEKGYIREFEDREEYKHFLSFKIPKESDYSRWGKLTPTNQGDFKERLG